MAVYKSLTKDGSEYTPAYIESVDPEKCLGCGRCFKACSRNVLGIEEIDEEDSARMYMVLENDANCIGCVACQKACPKGCFSFKPLEV